MIFANDKIKKNLMIFIIRKNILHSPPSSGYI